jgi:hypothetical protein
MLRRQGSKPKAHRLQAQSLAGAAAVIEGMSSLRCQTLDTPARCSHSARWPGSRQPAHLPGAADSRGLLLEQCIKLLRVGAQAGRATSCQGRRHSAVELPRHSLVLRDTSRVAVMPKSQSDIAAVLCDAASHRQPCGCQLSRHETLVQMSRCRQMACTNSFSPRRALP